MAAEPRTGLPRWFDVLAAAGGLLATAPVLVVVAVAVRLTSPGPALFRQQRIGRGGRPFVLLKFRTMVAGAAGTGAAQVTAGSDLRITRVGRWLRRTKLDELPQLWNVLRGDLALVGPRPEVARYVDLDDPLWHRVLAVRPGITDPVTLRLRDEERLLDRLLEATGPDHDLDSLYRTVLQPWKLRGYVDALDQRTVGGDLRCLVRTACGGGPGEPAAEELLASDGTPKDT